MPYRGYHYSQFGKPHLAYENKQIVKFLPNPEHAKVLFFKKRFVHDHFHACIQQLNQENETFMLTFLTPVWLLKQVTRLLKLVWTVNAEFERPCFDSSPKLQQYGSCHTQLDVASRTNKDRYIHSHKSSRKSKSSQAKTFYKIFEEKILKFHRPNNLGMIFFFLKQTKADASNLHSINFNVECLHPTSFLHFTDYTILWPNILTFSFWPLDGSSVSSSAVTYQQGHQAIIVCNRNTQEVKKNAIWSRLDKTKCKF